MVDLEGETLDDTSNRQGNETEEPRIAQLQPSPVQMARPSARRRWIYVSAAVLLVGLIGVALRQTFRTARPDGQNTSQLGTTPSGGPERALTFWLHVKMPKGNSTFEAFDSTGEEAFKVGSKIYFGVLPAQDGYLYIVNEGMGENGTKKWTAVFPNPKDNNSSARLGTNRQQEITGMTLDNNPGDEIVYFVWAVDPVKELEPLFQFEFKDKDEGVFGDPAQQDTLREFFQRNQKTPENKILDNGAQPRITMRGRGDLLIDSLTIKHRRYGS
jgi:hypothetical protein